MSRTIRNSKRKVRIKQIFKKVSGNFEGKSRIRGRFKEKEKENT